MPVTELAKLRLLSGNTPAEEKPSSTDTSTPSPPPIDATLLADLKHAQDVLTKSSGHPFQLYRCIEDPNLLYIIGSWESTTFHRTKFLPSKANQDLLATLKDQVEVEFMFHIDIDQTLTPIVTRPDLTKNNTLAIVRHFVSSEGQAQQFRDCFERVVPELRSFLEVTDGTLVGAWRIDEESDDTGAKGEKVNPEFVLFSSWPDVDRHIEFTRTTGFQKYSQIRDFCDRGVELRHVVALQY